ncbi:hypothetical protein [Fulvivirga sedimenti]|uniref:Uncharacterized protein n=1 Tax=Fulvivirga sedimenti TaxID=2879465 RepID=A0A9X1HUI4_9BACT|nr:hypothetical protein [Fulvivirga sedimenti]MCA6074762.1 hypothetical protein [Fulvivirga sedimenti]MCA6075939.1 hypothetical protein [Fulvivirga sedimenti]MCA6077067.1 hypothetical protein [Fulvivirga sedimenti]
MSDTLKSIFQAKHTPPSNCLNAFELKFPGAKHVEWFISKAYIEVVFYREHLEYIARFSPAGELIEYRRNLREGFLPLKIREMILSKGEIMNRVILNRGNEILYEVIYRNSAGERFMILIDDLGVMIEERIL